LNIIMIFLASKDWMLSNMIGALGFALIVGTMLGWIGDHRRLKYFTRWCQLYTLHCRCNS